MKVYYLNNENEKLDFSGFPLAIEEIEALFSKEWAVSLTGNSMKNRSKINSICRTQYDKKVNIQCYADSGAEFRKLISELMDITEKDLLSKVPGKLYVDEYYLPCFIYQITPGDYDELFYTVDNEARILSPYPFWIKEKSCKFYLNAEIKQAEEEKQAINNGLTDAEITVDYPYDYPYGYVSRYIKHGTYPIYDYAFDYYKDHQIGRLNNDGFSEAGFRMIVYGPCTKPSLYIGNNSYEVDTVLYDNEYLVIDSRERSVTKYRINGVTENLFNSRNKEKSVFQKIPSGMQYVKWNAQFSFDVTMYIERSEPVWNIS